MQSNTRSAPFEGWRTTTAVQCTTCANEEWTRDLFPLCASSMLGFAGKIDACLEEDLSRRTRLRNHLFALVPRLEAAESEKEDGAGQHLLHVGVSSLHTHTQTHTPGLWLHIPQRTAMNKRGTDHLWAS